jgi:hypothetical protein
MGNKAGSFAKVGAIVGGALSVISELALSVTNRDYQQIRSHYIEDRGTGRYLGRLSLYTTVHSLLGAGIGALVGLFVKDKPEKAPAPSEAASSAALSAVEEDLQEMDTDSSPSRKFRGREAAREEHTIGSDAQRGSA